MPEIEECIAHLVTGRHFHKKLGEEDENRKVLSLRGDSSNQDSGAIAKHLDAFEFDGDTRFTRGPRSAQTHVVPAEILRSSANPNPPHVSELDLVWEEVHGNGRAIFLVFRGGRVFEFHWLTHSSIQLYTRHVWDKSIMKVDREHRGFRIAIAFEFKDYFLSFNSIDLVVKPIWRTLTPAELKLPLIQRLKLGIDVYRDFDGFLEAVAIWILHRRRGSSKRAGLACEAMRSANLVWVGLGVYTVCEVFFLAGCSPFLLEFEVFDCPSRTARLCEAFWTFAHEAQTVWKDLIRGALCERLNLIAPTDEQRLKYADHLYVYAKGQTAIPPRMMELLNEYHARLAMLDGPEGTIYTRDSIDDLYDVFEPTFIFDALVLTVSGKKHTLGHLIFNPAVWGMHGHGKGAVAGKDKLTLMYVDEGLWCPTNGAKTFLKLLVYKTFLKDTVTALGNYSRPRVHAYRAAKQIWSLVTDYPNSLVATTPPPPTKSKPNPIAEETGRVTPIDSAKQEKMEFKWMVKNSNRVVVGPLEYCGHGKVVKTARKPVLLAVHGDPRVGKYYSRLSLWSLYSGKGKSRKKLTNAQRRELEERASAPRKAGFDTDVESDEDSDSESEEDDEEQPSASAPSLPPLPTTPVRDRVLTLKDSDPTTSLASANSLPVTPISRRVLAARLSSNLPSSPTLYQPSSPTIAAPSLPAKRRFEEEGKENLAEVVPQKKVRKVGSGLGPRKSQDKHLVVNATLRTTPSPKGGPRRSRRRR